MQAIQPHNSKASATWGAGGANYDNVSRTIADAIGHCVLKLDPQPGERILDVATGTGWAARLLAEKGANVTGIDLGTDLIEAAKKIALEKQLKIDFQTGDAEALAFPDSSFDAVMSTFGVMFVSKPEAAAAELARVCKKGGRIALTTWFTDGSIFGLFKVMKPYQPPAPVSAPPSPFAWGSRDRVTELLGAHFDLKFETGNTVMHASNGLAVWDLFVGGYGPTKMLAASLDPERLAALKKDFIAYHEGFKSESGVAMPREYLVTIGVRK